MTLSGGMKRRVLIAKALAHEPQILFLDEPTAGVDVELRQDMWEMVRALRERGVTIILTTHYIEEAEEMADRDRRDQQGRDHPGRGQGRADAQARQEAAHAAAARSRSRRVPPALAGYRLALARRRAASWSTPTTRRASAPASPRCSTTSSEAGIRLQATCRPRRARSRTSSSSLVRDETMNLHAVRAIYMFEMARTGARCCRASSSPVISTSLYFVVFGAAIGSRITEIDGVSYGAFIVPGPDHAVAADAEHRRTPRSASTSRASPARSTSSCRRRSRYVEIVLGYVGAAATKSIILGLIILATARPVRAAAASRIRSGCWPSWC